MMARVRQLIINHNLHQIHATLHYTVFVLWNSMTSLPIWLPSSVIQFKLRNIQKAVLLNSGSLGASLFRRPWSAWSSPCHPALGCDPVPPPGMTFIANILKLKFSMDTQLEFSLKSRAPILRVTSSKKLLRELMFWICKRNNSSLIGQWAGHVTRFLKSYNFKYLTFSIETNFS